MAIYKCKMCGAQLEVTKGSTIATCSFCMSKQTVANADDERKENLFNRANTLRINCEFDKALLAYQSIISIFPHEPEAHWGVVLCKYGIEYVDDHVSKSKKPTIHRMAYESILKDSDYLATLAYADVIAKSQYIEEATQIANIQKNILSISQKEEPFDIFICYKETDKNGNRTHDSVMAQEIYTTLVEKGYKVFFSKITLENKLGTMYEPYIFAALNSAKIMLVLGTKQEYFNAVWVKNEWSRFISLMQTRPDHYLIPCYKDMNAYEMPEEFLAFQAQDLSKLGFMQDLIRGIDKIMGKDVNKVRVETREIQSEINIEALLTRSEILINDNDYQKADELIERVLNTDPKNSKAYLLKCVIELNLKSIEDLKKQENVLDKNNNFIKAYKFGDAKEKEKLDNINTFIDNRNKDKTYNVALKYKENGDFEEAKKVFNQIVEYKDVKNQIEDCERLEIEKKYQNALSLKEQGDYDNAIKVFKLIISFKDASYQIEECNRIIEEAKKEAIYVACLIDKKVNTSHIKLLKDICKKLSSIQGYKDSDMLLVDYESKIKELEKQEKEEKARRIKKVKIVSTIVTSITAFITFALLLMFLHIMPEINENEIEKLIDEKNYSEAYERLENNNYGQSKKLVEMCKAGEALESLDFETGISLIYNIGGTVDVNYCANGGTSIKTHETIKKKAFIDNDFDKAGFISRGWKLTQYTLKSSNFYAEINLEAQYDIFTYSITYDLNGGNCENLPSTYTIEDTIKLPNPTRTGYTFIGWTCIGDETPKKDYTIPKGTIGHKTFKANWKANEYELLLNNTNSNAGSVSGSGIYEYDSSVTISATPNEGYTFIGWYNEQKTCVSTKSTYTFTMGLSSTLTAKWSNEYELSLNNTNSNAGSVSGSGIYEYDSSVTISATPNEGYEFTGWYDEQGTCVSTKNTYTFTMGLSNTLTARWDYAKIILNYVVDGEVVHTEPFKLNSNITNLYQYKTNKNFYGWYKSAIFSSSDDKVRTTEGLSIVNNNAYLYGCTLDTKFDFMYGYKITKYTDTKTDVVIPSTINGIDVTNIGESAFYNCSSLTSITIPNSVTSIGKSAFYGCRSLTSIVIPNSVKSIGDSAFRYCSSLTSIVISNSVTRIGEYAFNGCGSLTSITIPNSVTSIGESAFNNCSSLTSITIPNSVTKIGESAFNNCSLLQYNEYGNCLYLGNEENPYLVLVKAKGTSITEATISNNTRFIMNNAFYKCSSLRSITIPNSVTSIGDNAFEYCSSLTSITIPNSVTSIGEYAFGGCSSLTIYCEASSELSEWNLRWNSYGRPVYWRVTQEEIIYQDGLQFLIIDGNAVVTGHDANITNIVIPSTITMNSSTYNVTSIGNRTFFNFDSLTSIVIPNTVTSIGDHAFSRCSSLTSITIPNSVTSIGEGTFNFCDSLTIYCEASSQPSGWDSYWNSSDRPTYWGGTWSYANSNPTPNK